MLAALSATTVGASTAQGPSWPVFLFTALFTFAGSSALAAIITGVMTGNRGDTERLINDLRSLQDELGALRAKYRKHEKAPILDDPELDMARDSFESAAYRCIDARLIQAAKRYVSVGDRYAANDPDVGYASEKTAYDALAGNIAVLLRGLTPRPRRIKR